MTAQQVVERIQKKLQELKIQWRSQTVDTFKAGSPETEVRAIATTGMATFDVLHRAAGEDPRRPVGAWELLVDQQRLVRPQRRILGVAGGEVGFW